MLKEIKTAKTECNEMVVKRLEELLEKARSGEIVGIAGAMLLGDSDIKWFWSGAFDPYQTVGCLEELKAEILKMVNE